MLTAHWETVQSNVAGTLRSQVVSIAITAYASFDMSAVSVFAKSAGSACPLLGCFELPYFRARGEHKSEVVDMYCFAFAPGFRCHFALSHLLNVEYTCRTVF